MASQASINAVAAVFQNVFGRAPTSQESSGWASQLDSGATSAQLAAVLAGSAEGAAQVSSLYQQVLGRGLTNISSSEIASGEAYLAQDKANGLASLRTSMAFSAEAQADIKAVYQNVLGRTATSGEVTSSESALANGATLAQLYTSAAASPELTANLAAIYKSDFGTAPSTSVMTFMRQQIVSGDTFANLASALASQAPNSGGGTTTTVTSGASGPAISGTNGTNGASGANGTAVNGTNGSSSSLADTFNPAESLLSSGSTSSAAPATTATNTPASAASPLQLTNPATAGITPTLHSS